MIIHDAAMSVNSSICLALAGKILQKELRFLFVIKIILLKRLLNLVLSLFMNKSP